MNPKFIFPSYKKINVNRRIECFENNSNLENLLFELLNSLNNQVIIDTADLEKTFHIHGINMIFLGKIYALVGDPYLKNLIMQVLTYN
jgi:hypothetical protein